MSKIVLHIGFGKTGSSSIQRYLSLNGANKLLESDFVYCAFDQNGEIKTGEELVDAARVSVQGYIASSHILPSNKKTIGRLCNGLINLIDKGLIPIFSHENWVYNSDSFKRIFSSMPLKVHAIAFVRPQVDFFNSGWWQWWYWMEQFKKPEDVINSWNFGFMCWFKHLNKWAQLLEVKKLDVILYRKDSVNDFLATLGLSMVESERINIGMNELMVKTYNAIPHLRKVHDSEFDYILGPLLSSRESAPWSVPFYLAEQIIEGTKNDNLKLLSLLEKHQQTEMISDSRWWSAEKYRNKKSIEGESLKLTFEDALHVIRAILPTLLKCRLNKK
jgi:hypothetical protein